MIGVAGGLWVALPAAVIVFGLKKLAISWGTTTRTHARTQMRRQNEREREMFLLQSCRYLVQY
jgi:hypothetical protein